MKIRENTVDLLSNIIKEGYNTVSRDAIFKTKNGYKLFGAYEVTCNVSFCSVTKGSQEPRYFSTIKIATAWCIADKINNINLARQIAELDVKCTSIKNDIDASKQRLACIKNNDMQDIVFAKISSKEDTLRIAKNQLTKCINLAKYWQIKGFVRNETART